MPHFRDLSRWYDPFVGFYFRFPLLADTLAGGLVAGLSLYLQAEAARRFHYRTDLDKGALSSFADQLCSASISTAGFVFTALALFVSIGENYRSKVRDEKRKAEESRPVVGNVVAPPRPSDGFDTFFLSPLYAQAVGVFLWSSVELFMAFGVVVSLKFVWSLVPDWLCAVVLLLSFALLVGGILRAVYISYKVMMLKRAIV